MMNKEKNRRTRFFYNLTIIVFFIIALIISYPCPEISIALMFSFFVYYLCFFIGLLNFKLRPDYFLIAFSTDVITFIILLICSPFIGGYMDYGVLFFEVIVVIFFSITRFWEKRIRNNYIRNDKMKDLALFIRLNAFFRAAKVCQYVFTIHLIAVLVYRFYFVAYQTPELTHFLFSHLNVTFVFIIAIYEYSRVFILRSERWLPIINENGNVTGKIAHKESISSGEKHLHPVVRIALIHKNLLYLSKRSFDTKVDSGMLDFPLESLVEYGQDLEETVNQILQKKDSLKGLSEKFVFKHIYQFSLMHGLIYLYIVQISSPRQAEAIKFKGGKWWTQKHINENLNKGIFSKCFEMEYEVLQNTILLANRIIEQSLSEKNG